MRNLQKNISLLIAIYVCFTGLSIAQVKLSHNVGNTITGRHIHGCSGGNVYWARTFTLEDFDITPGKNFVISSGEAAVAYDNVNWDSRIQFNIYSIDANFPVDFSEASLIGSSQVATVYDSNFPIYTLNFETPVIVPHSVKRILVEVHQLWSNNSLAALFCAGTDEDNDISWFKGCSNPPLNGYTNTVDMNYPLAKFYITVTGNEQEPVMDLQDILRSTTVVFPNPAKETLTINSDVQITKFELRNLLGQIVLKDKLESSEKNISVSNINKGTYLLSMEAIDGSVITRKIVKD